MRIAQCAVAILLLVGAAGAQNAGSASEVRTLASRVERLEQRLAQLEARRTGGMFRIVTENKNREGVEALLKERFSGFTIFEARGHFKGAEGWYDESSLVIEIAGAGRAEMESAACAIRELNQQEAVLLEEVPARSLLLSAPAAGNGAAAARQRRKGGGSQRGPGTRTCARRLPVR